MTLASRLEAEDQTVQSMPDASPTKWHLAHTTWIFETFLLTPHLKDYAVFHPRYGYLFNSYYEAEGTRHPRLERGLLTRPTLDEVLALKNGFHHADTFLIHWSTATAAMMREPMSRKVHCGFAPAIRRPSSNTPTISAPKKAPRIEPRPPNREIPPITTAVMDWMLPITPVVADGETDPKRPIITQPASPQMKPTSI